MKSLFILFCLLINLNLFATQYQLIDVGLLDKDSSELHCINNKSELCGVYADGRSKYAYVWKQGDSNDKPFRSPNKIFITNSSLIYGSYFDWVDRGFWSLDQETLYKWKNPFSFFNNINCDDIGYPPSLYSTGHHLFTVALKDVNDLGQLLVMDNDIINRNYKYEVWVYDKDKFIRIHHPCLDAAIRINNQSQILGFYFENLFSKDGEPLGTKGKRAVIYNLNDKQVTLFNTVGDAWAEDMNDLGEVVGTIRRVGSEVGFIGTPDQMTEIPNFYPFALNNSRQVIGAFKDTYDKLSPAIWENGKLIRLSDHMNMVDNNGNEWDRIDVLTDINDLGEIVGQGLIKGKPHGFLLLPIR